MRSTAIRERVFRQKCYNFVTSSKRTPKKVVLKRLMGKPCTLLPFALLVVCLLSSCANPHFFPRLQPLFPGLDEAGLSAADRTTLAQAKTDFLLVKHGKTPQYATLVSADPHTRSRVYQGQAYRLTSVREDNTYSLRNGPEIVFSPNLTGGKPYHYDEVDSVAE
jgi:hypothetical protein